MNQHIFCLKKACDGLNIKYTEVGQSGVFLRCEIKGQAYYFIANEVPFNDHIVSRVTEDKFYTYELLSDSIEIPPCLSFIDPNCDELYQSYLEFRSTAAIADAICQHFSLPVIVKKNSGRQGIHVFKCQDRDQIMTAIDTIYNRQNLEYDHVLLAQQYIDIAREFRVTVFDQKILLVYEKDFSQAKFIGNLSPFHWQGAKAKIIDDQTLTERIDQFIQPIYQKIKLRYGGLDIALDKNNKLWLFEINSKPAYNYLIDDNGPEVLIQLYQKILGSL